MRISIYKTYLILIFYIAPFIDAFSGYLILSGIISEGGAGSPSQIFRFIVLILMLLISWRDKKIFYFLIGFIVYIIFIEFSFFVVHQNIYGYIIGLVYGNKLVYLVLVFISLYILIKNNQLSFIILLMHLRNYIVITSLIMIISFLSGTGFNTYDEGTFGIKGFFAASNGLGIFMGIGLLLSIYYWKITRENFSLLLVFMILFSTIIIGSKTALLLSIVGFVSIVLFLNNIFLTTFVSVAVLSFIGYYFDEIVTIFYTIFDVIIFRFGNSDSIFSWIFSNRDNYFVDAISSISFDGFLFLRLFVGFGTYISFRNPFESYLSIDVLETDFADILFMYGLFFIVFYMFFILFNLYNGIKNKKYYLSFLFILLMGHSLIAGHVLFNGMSGLLVPLLSIFLLTNKQELKCKK